METHAGFGQYFGLSKRRHSDPPDKAIGRRLALRRATEAIKHDRRPSMCSSDPALRKKQIQALWDLYYGVYEPCSLRGQLAVRNRQLAKQFAEEWKNKMSQPPEQSNG